MGGEKYLGILENFNTKILDGLTRILTDYREELKKKSVGSFNSVTTYLANQAISKFKTLHPEQSELEDATLHILLISAIVEKFNGVLPLDYPYVIVLLDIEDESPRLHLATIPRALVPVLYESVNTNMVPICFIKTRSDLTNPSLRFPHVDFLGQ